MNNRRGIGVIRPFALAVGLSLLSYQGIPPTAIAFGSQNPDLKAPAGFKPPADKPAPPSRSTNSGGSRGPLGCPMHQPSQYSPLNEIRALLPKEQNQVGYTGDPYPVFMAYLPATTAKEIVLTLRDEQKRKYTRTYASISRDAGWVAVPMPRDVPPLALNQYYQWFITVKCADKSKPDEPFAEGWIKRIRVSSKVESILSQAPSINKAQVLGEAGLWFDIASTLGQLRITQPKDSLVTNSWKRLLQWTTFTEPEIDILTHLPTITKQQSQ